MVDVAESPPALRKEIPRVVVVPLINPADREFVGPKNTVVQTYGFRVPQLGAVVDLIFRGQQ